MKKSVFAFAITLAILLTMFPSTAFGATVVASGYCGGDTSYEYDETSQSYKNLTYTLDSNGLLTIDGTGNMKDYYYSPYAAPWYNNRTDIKTIDIENSVTSIGNCAFVCCGKLTSINISASVTDIGKELFSYCDSLSEIIVEDGNPVYHSAGNCIIETNCKKLIAGCKASVIPADGSVTSIGRSAFSGCHSLVSITIPNGVQSIGNEAFFECSSLTSVTIPNSIQSIGVRAFWDCGLTSIAIPCSVQSIGDESFCSCEKLSNVTINEGVQDISENMFNGCSNLTNIAIPSSMRSIKNGAFSFCSSLVSITIPNGVISIGSGAFTNCSSLTSINVPSSVQSISSDAFSGCSSLTSINVDKENTVYHSKGDCLIETASKVLLLGCQTSIIPMDGSVTSIGDWAFFDSSNLTNITIPSSVTSIGNWAFCNCSGLTNIAIPNSVTHIGQDTFWCCDGLISVTIPNSVTSIGRSAFRGCRSLTNITVAEGNLVYHSAGNCIIETDSKTLITGCKTSIIPADGSVTSIGGWAFFGCSGLTNITIPSNVTNIGEYAFLGCNGLISITVSDSVTNIGEYAFFECTCLTDVYYSGTQAQWEAIAVGYDNTPIASATIHYESFGMKGDINGDGVVAITDLQALYEYLCGTKILIDSYALSVTDVNGDNTVNILDYQALYEIVKS